MKVVVIGAGLLGLSTAYNLRKAGAEVCIVERNSAPALETSFANGGMLHASQANPWNEPGILTAAIKMLGREDAALLIRAKALPGMFSWGLRFLRHSRPRRYAENLSKNARLARYSLSVLQEMRDSIELDYDQQLLGTIKMFRSQAALAHAVSFAHRFDELGIPYEVCDVARLITLEPALGAVKDSIAGALYFPSDEVGDAYKYCLALHRWCQNNGVALMFDCAAEGFEIEQSKVNSVLTNQAAIAADNVVIACGSYSTGLARRAGVALPIQPVKGYSITLPIDEWREPPKIAVIDDEMHAAVCPLGDRLRVAGTAEFAGFDQHLTPSRINNLVTLLKNLYPGYTPYYRDETVQAWAGLRPMTYDGVGIMGKTRLSNLYINAGHGHLGWTMAAGAGRAISDLMIGTSSELAVADYALERFE